MTWTIPTETPYEIKRKQRGIKVWAVQRALNSVGFALSEDGIFGAITEEAVREYQGSAGLKVDGSFGPKTSGAMADSLLHDADTPQLPSGLLLGVIEGESGKMIAAVNHQVAGGVDCGYCQRRVYDSDMSDGAIQRAFDGEYQIKLLATALLGRHNGYYGDPGAKTHEAAWRIAVLYHNYPALADRVARYGVAALGDYYKTPQQWVVNIGAKFPDGVRIETPLEWAQHYSLGNPDHDEPGMMVKYAFPLS